MSVKIDLAFTVTGVSGEPQAWEIVCAVEELLREEFLILQVSLGVAVDDDGVFFVSGESDLPLGISRFYLWRPHFEGLFAATVAQVSTDASAKSEWGYPDEEH